MATAKKFKHYYPKEGKKSESISDSRSQNIKDKELIKIYQDKIQDLLKEPQKQKKAALIIEQLINSGKK